MLKILFLVLFLCLSTSAYSKASAAPSKEDKAEIFDMADQWAQCSAMYEALSTTPTKAQSGAVEKSLHELSLGWEIAAAWVLFQAQVISDWKGALDYVANTKATVLQHNKALIELSDHSLLEDFRKLQITCEGWHTLQEQSVKEFRRDMYSQKN